MTTSVIVKVKAAMRFLRTIILPVIAASVAIAQIPQTVASSLPAKNSSKTALRRGEDELVYRMFFAFANRINIEADSAERANINSHYLRSYFQDEAALTPAQASVVSDAAAALASQLAQYDAHAAELRKQRHVLVQTKQLRGEVIPPVAAEILGLEGGRDALILQAHSHLRQSLGEDVFARLDAYVRTAPWKKPIIPPPPGQANSSQKAAAAVPDRVYYVSLFHSIGYFKAQAEEERKLGLNEVADSLLGLVQSQSGLTKQAFQIVDAAATRYSLKHSEAAKHAEAAEASYRKLALEMLARDRKVTATPQAVAAWNAVSDVYKQFENETDNAVKTLRADLGEETFVRLDSFVKRKFTVKADAQGVSQ